MNTAASEPAPFANGAMAAFEASVARALETGHLAGAVAVATAERGTVYQRAFGWREVAVKAPMALDTVFMLASMTKTVTSVAAMQLVEQGNVGLDQPLGEIVSELADLKVLEGFDAAGAPRLRPAKRPVTLRHLLTHTSGFGHDIWSPGVARYQAATGIPALSTQTNASLRLPLMFDPGEKWEYGVGLEWVGKVVEAASGVTLGAYLREHVTGPLGMRDTVFGIVPGHRGRIAQVYQRENDGSLRPIDMSSMPGEYEAGGGGLYGTAIDYLVFLRMLLNHGLHQGRRILKPDTVALMGENHCGRVAVAMMKSSQPQISNDFELFPDMVKRWGLGAMITPEAGPNGRSPGSQSWGGIANCYFWLDPVKRVAGIFLTQIMPFGDKRVLDLSGQFERGVYGLPR
jgi:CubicO group peptidase (beta-lactamase class C family)